MGDCIIVSKSLSFCPPRLECKSFSKLKLGQWHFHVSILEFIKQVVWTPGVNKAKVMCLNVALDSIYSAYSIIFSSQTNP